MSPPGDDSRQGDAPTTVRGDLSSVPRTHDSHSHVQRASNQVSKTITTVTSGRPRTLADGRYQVIRIAVLADHIATWLRDEEARQVGPGRILAGQHCLILVNDAHQ
jgi:hypothetical protein